MLKLTPVSSALAALIIASALSGCGAGPVEPVSATTSATNAQATADVAAEATAAADATRAAQEAAAAEAAAAAKAASDAKAAADAKAKAAAAAKAKAAAAAPAPVAKPAPKPAPAPAAAKTYANCTAMHVDYKGGVARPGAVDHRSSGHANYAPVYSTALYNANKGSDRDGDGIACEA